MIAALIGVVLPALNAQDANNIQYIMASKQNNESG
jgi:hypothetical protein